MQVNGPHACGAYWHTRAAAWAGHSVEMLMRVYARCVVGLEGIWIGRMDEALHLGEDR